MFTNEAVRRALLGLAAALSLAASGGAFAQANFPDRPVRIIVGFPPGSTADIIARLIAPRMSESLGQPVVVENRAGGGSGIAAESVAACAASQISDRAAGRVFSCKAATPP